MAFSGNAALSVLGVLCGFLSVLGIKPQRTPGTPRS